MATIYDCKKDPRRKTVWGSPQYGVEETMVLHYSFDELGGAQGDYILGTLPANCIVNQVAYICTTAFSGSGDAETLGTTSGGTQLCADMAGVSADTVTAGVPAINNVTMSSWIKVTADTDIYFTIASGDVTAGEVYFFIRYINIPAA